jgi:hypothetical protein
MEAKADVKAEGVAKVAVLEVEKVFSRLDEGADFFCNDRC